MKYRKLFISITVSFGISNLSISANAAPCEISKSIYSDVNNRGFDLIFGAKLPNSPWFATAIIRHPKLGTLWTFDVTQSNGYGSTALIARAMPNTPPDTSFVISFFNENLESDTFIWGRKLDSPKYAFIQGLGSTDYYRRRARPPFLENLFLSDTMWTHKRCQ